jgi:hypothetical protein
MPTSRELKMLLRPLLQRRPDLAFVGRTLFFAPFTHYLRGVFFYPRFYSSGATPEVFAQQLYRGWSGIDFSAWESPNAFRIEEDWKHNVAQTSQWLCDLLEQEVLPRIEPIVDFATHFASPYRPKFLSPLAQAVAACTVGDFETAEAISTKHVEVFDEWPLSSATDDVRYSDTIWWRMPYLLRTLRADRSKVIPLLHDWEAYSVNLNKMTKYWKSTPFPCEL